MSEFGITVAPQFTIGNSSRNPVRGPNYRNADIALIKRIHFSETRNLELRAEAFNLTNTPPLGAPNTVLASPGFGSITSALWLNMPYVLPDAYFIAKDGDQYVGLSDVSLFDALPGGVTQGFTGVLRKYRRRGIATSLKLREIEYVRAHSYKVIQSFNRPAQSAVLALNQKLGFQILSSNVTLEKCLREVIEVDQSVYDEYAGHYRDDERRPEVEMIIRNEGGRLTIEAVGQKVELFPISETQFFVKQFYGEATFVRDEDGRVDLLKFVMPEYKTRQASIQHAKRITCS
ncbi:MAG TPA: DUF3471 domain-containing protein [Pyrinomonadaceae bacterium]|nr:DUF3471 domain-containing protein [Pyrinomonadaceae bacterium]